MPFSRVIGHEAVAVNLRRLILDGRLAHAYMFAGPEGVGKFFMALEFAAAVLCPRAAGAGESCGSCPSCARVYSGNHSDLAIFQPEEGRQFVADLVEQLQSQISLKPRGAERRVFILRDAQEMNATAANRLLKTLEEPPPYALLILVTSSLAALPETILSRCRMVRFGPLSVEQITRILVERAGLEPREAGQAARLAMGSAGQALLFGAGWLREARRGMIEAIASARGATHLALSDSLARLADAAGKSAFERRAATCRLMALLAAVYRDAAALGLGAGVGQCVNADAIGLIEALAQEATPEVNLDRAEKALEAARCIAQNANVTMVLDDLAHRLIGG